MGTRNSSVSVTVTGSNFTVGATTAISGTEVTLGAPNVTSSTTMTIQFTISATAPIGVRHLSVATGGGTSPGSPFTVAESSLFTTFHKTWVGGATGAVDDWATAANWSPSGVPAPGHNVFIPGALSNYPVVRATTSIGDLYLAPGAALTIAEFVNLDAVGHVFAGNTITGSGWLAMHGASKQVAGTVQNLNILGTISGMAPVTVLGDMFVLNSGTYTVAGKTLDVRGNLSVTNSATLSMMSPADLVKVTGLATFAGGSTVGLLTAGTLELKGSFAQAGGATAFHADPGHTTRFVGGGIQTVSFGSATSHFGRVQISNTAGGEVQVSTGISVNAMGNLELLTASAKLTGGGVFTAYGNFPRMTTGAQVTIASLCIGGDVDARDAVNAGSLTFFGTNKTLDGIFGGNVIIAGTIKAFSGSTISGAMTVMSGGQFDVNGMIVGIGTDFTTSGTGKLKMINSFDRLNVGRDVAFGGGSTTGLLTAGILSVGRHFTQTGVGTLQNSFTASSGHMTKFVGSVAQNVSFDHTSVTESHFGNVEIANLSGGSVTIAASKTALAVGYLKLITPDSRLTGAGTMIANGDFPNMSAGAQLSIANLVLGGFVSFGLGIGDGNLALTLTGVGGDKTLVGTVNGSVNVTGNYLAIGAVTITKNLTVSGTGGIYVVGNFVTSVGQDFKTADNGKLAMDGIPSILTVAGNMEFSGGSTAGFLTAGKIEVKKNFKQTAANSTASFSASGTHLTKFSGTTTQNLEFANPGATLSHFQDVEIANSSALGVNVPSGNPLALGYLNLTSNGILTGVGAFTANGNFTAAANTEVSTATLTIGGSIDASNAGMRMYARTTANGTGTLKGTFGNNIEISGSIRLDGLVTVEDSVVSVIAGSLDLSGYTLYIKETGAPDPQIFFTSGAGVLRMAQASDRLLVEGNVTFGGGSTAGKLTAGEIHLRGNFTQSNGGGSSDSFSASGSHLVKFVGTGVQNIQFAQSAQSTHSHFNDIEVANSDGDDAKLVSGSVDIFVVRDVKMNGSTSKLTLDKQLTYFGTLTDAGTIVNRTNLINGGAVE